MSDLSPDAYRAGSGRKLSSALRKTAGGTNILTWLMRFCNRWLNIPQTFSGSWCEVLQLYTKKASCQPTELTEEQRELMMRFRGERGAKNPDYCVATRYGLISLDEYDPYGSYALTALGLQHCKLGPVGGYEFYLNRLKRYHLENVRSRRTHASATFVLEFERTELAPQGPPDGERRVARGGAWNNSPFIVRVSARMRPEPSVWDDHLGFRCVEE